MAIFLSGAFIIFMAVAFPIEDIASATDAMFLLLFVFVNLAVINLRKNRPDLDRGFKVPLFPYIPIAAAVLNLSLAVFLFFYRPIGVLVCLGYILLGIVIYYYYSRKKEFSAKAEPVIHAEHPLKQEEPRSFRILVPIANQKTVEQLMDFAARIARSKSADITVMNIIQIPAQLPPSEGRKYLGQARELLFAGIKIAEEQEIPVYSLVKVSRKIPKSIIETCEERKINLVVLGWEGDIPARNRVFGTIMDEVILNTTCDIAMVCKPPFQKIKLR
jgi:nucleotide-binding universal stress UspA family protein